jgi:Ca2+-binding EF-hand superfamily protein
MTQRFPFLPAAFCAVVLAGASVAACAQTQAPASESSARARLAVEAAFNRADANGDGKLSREEAGHLPAIALKFDDLDTNKDGFLSMEEFSAVLNTPAA